jgi:MFS family permease
LLSVGITALVLITTWGGSEYPWVSGQILGLAALSAVSLVAFGFVERRAAEPIVSLQLFKIRNFAVISAIGFLLGFAMFGAINFLPLYQQIVQGQSATNSGLLLLPLMLGLLVVSVLAGRTITRTGRYKIFPVLGGIVMTLGMVLLSRVGVHTSEVTLAVYMVVLGVGMGGLMQTTMLIAQNSVETRDLGVASSAATFFRSIGGSFGISLFGAVFAHRLTDDLAARLGTEMADRMTGSGGGARLDPESIRLLPAPVREALLTAVAHGSATVFGWAVLFTAAVPLLALLIKEVPLRGEPEKAAPAGADPVEPALHP